MQKEPTNEFEAFDPLNDHDNIGSDILAALGMEGAEFGVYGDTIICEHGTEIEMDGRCPEGCVGIM